jgi:hypothetical protein
LNNKQGAVQYNLTDFYRTRQDGSGTELIYTTSNIDVRNYGFYHYSGTTYLVVLDGTNLVSVNATAKKPPKTASTIAEGVESVMFSKKPVWHSGVPENTTEDFVYFTRAATQNDNDTAGSVLERIRPSGDDGSRFVLLNNGYSVTLNSLKTGYLYYSVTELSGTSLYANNFVGIPKHVSEIEEDENGVKKIPDAADAMTPVLISADAASLTNIYAGNRVAAFYKDPADEKNNVLSVSHYVLAVKNSSTVCINYPSSVETVILNGVSATVVAVDGNDFFYTSADGSLLFRANIFEAGQTGFQISAFDTVSAAHLTPSVAAGYVIYSSVKNTAFGVEDKINDGETYKYATNYMKIRRNVLLEYEKEWDMYVMDGADIPAEDPDPEEEDETDDAGDETAV